jgi:UDP:flavonoid glycosyltransferase YjiC (YdhE family)
LKFLGSGPAPLFGGFGSVGRQSDNELFINAGRRAGIRIVVSSRPAIETEEVQVDRDVYRVLEMPHSWLFPRLAGVIHPGSAGTTTTALRAGVPSTAVPHQFDQHYYAARLSLLGVGPVSVPRRLLNLDQMVRLMVALTAGSEASMYRRRAAILGKGVGAERGVIEAISILRREGVLRSM